MSAIPEWQDNTEKNPFWRQKDVVEVMLKNGSFSIFKCPRCSMGMMKYVIKWRPVLDAKHR